MFILVTCECGRCFETAETHAGRRARCPVCGRELIVPTPEVLVIPDAPATLSGKAIASFVFGLLFVFACLAGVPAILLGHSALREINRSGGRLHGRKLALAGIVLGWVGCLFTVAFLMSAYRSAGEAARRAWCINNLKQIGFALHNYHETWKQFPPAAITDKNGKPLLSWRVAILPFTDHSQLHEKFHLDEPWDSPHNFALLKEMPSYYACPSDMERKPGMSGYVAVIGAATCFRPDFQAVRIQDITDGTSNTLLIGESRRAVPWTKPDDLPFDINITRSGLDGFHSQHVGGFNALFADGYVHFIKRTINPDVLRARLTRNDNEAEGPDMY